MEKFTKEIESTPYPIIEPKDKIKVSLLPTVTNEQGAVSLLLRKDSDDEGNKKLGFIYSEPVTIDPDID